MTPSFILGWYLFQAELPVIKEAWAAFVAMTGELLIQVCGVGGGVLLLTCVLPKRWPLLNETFYHTLSRLVRRRWSQLPLDVLVAPVGWPRPTFAGLNSPIVVILVYGMLGFNSEFNSPDKSLSYHAVAWGIGLATLLLIGISYRTVLALSLVEVWLAWLCVTQSVAVGTAALLLLAVAFVLWMAHNTLDDLLADRKTSWPDDDPNGKPKKG